MVTHNGNEHVTLRGRHRTPRRSTIWLVAALVVAVMAGAAAGGLALWGHDRSVAADSRTCGLTGPLLVAAAPEVAPIVASLAGSISVPGCASTRVQVQVADPASLARQGKSYPDVWIPDSTLWLAKATSLPAGTLSHGSIARSPIVLAVATRVARGLGSPPELRRVADAATTADPIVLGVGDPARSAAALGLLVSLQKSLAGDASEVGNLAALLRGMTSAPNATAGNLPVHPVEVDGSPVAIPTTEHAVWAADHAARATTYTAIYPPAPASTLDYPFVTLSRNTAVARAADALLTRLQSASARTAFARSGFRSPNGAPPPVLTGSPGVDASAPATGGAPTAAQVAALTRALATVNKPSRLLALIDVSGSMGLSLPGPAGTTRIAIARTAAAEGLGLLPSNSAAGLWRFSANLSPTTDYQQLVPVAPLNDGVRGQLAAAVGQLDAVPNGGTGLYDSILAAVTAMRQSFDPTRVNSVVVLTDGKDEADPEHRIALHTLIAQLTAERTSTRPVKVIAIAYGPSSDTGALVSISAASGGILYHSENPQDLPAIFRNAIGRRLCQSSC